MKAATDISCSQHRAESREVKMELLQVRRVFGLIVGLTAAWNAAAHSHGRQPSYLLLTPGSIRPGVPTSLSVTVLSSSPVTVSADIVHGNQTAASTSATVAGGSTQLLTLPPIQESESGYWRPYCLEVRGHMGSALVFSNKTQLRFNPKCLSTFIQTDKATYRAQEAVKIRVVSVRPDGAPYVSPVDIVIRDPKGNLLRQWLNVDSVLGAASKQFQLSEHPPLGRWTIAATAGGVSSEKHFNVASYVLPKFDVTIKVPKVVHQEEVLRGSVVARYTYGKPVYGHMNVAFLYHFHGLEDTLYDSKKMDGEADFVFDLPVYHLMKRRAPGMSFYHGYTEHEFISVQVHVTETLTGLTYNQTAKVSVARFKYKLCFDGFPQILRPPLNFSTRLKLSTYNGRLLPVEDQRKTVQVSVMQRRWTPWMWEAEPRQSNLSGWFLHPTPMELTPEEMELPVPADGVIPIDIQLMNDTETLTIDAYFEDSHNTLQLYRSYTSPSNSYLQIQRPSEPLEVGSSVRLHIESNFPVTEIHYLVKSRGTLVSAGKSSAALSLVPESTWAPLAHVIVYCVHPSGEVVNDAIQLHVAQTLTNQVNVSWSRETSQPGDEVTLRVDVAEPASLVGILVVDKATQWAGSKNDITENRVLEEMRSYGRSKMEADSDAFPVGDPLSVFKTCDLVVLTDASLPMMHHHLTGEGIYHLEQDWKPNMEPPEEPRENFPETWIWMDVNTGNSLSSELALTVPDSITTWAATAFVMSEHLGLGIVKEPAQLTVFQDFFLSLNFPACVIRGEELLLEIILFNYLPQDLEVTLTVARSDTFEFVFPDLEQLPLPAVRHVLARSRLGASVRVPIRPLVLGQIPISVRATTAAASDLVRATVLVKAEGLEQSFSSSLLLEVSASQSSFSKDVTFSFPADVVKGSERVSVSAVGDLLGPSISGLDHLIQMPHGCGEQNMINFAPNVYVLRYLSAAGQATRDATDRATAFMTTGYERQLSYQRVDGSFSAFGDQDASGSTWLSAFVLRCFLQARPFVGIDAHVLRRAAAWLAAQQGVDGRFEEPGRVIHTELQGGLDGPVSLTAYVLIAFLEDADVRAQYGGQLSMALMFLETRLALGVTSNYSLSLLTYALSLAGSSGAGVALSELMGRAEMKDGVPTWSSPRGGLASSWQPRSADIEMASYLLLAHHELDLIADGLSLMKWLSRQRNHGGGFGSTQDTVVALQALSTFAAAVGSHDLDLTITVTSDADAAVVASFNIHQDNYLVRQSQQIEAEEAELKLKVTAEGRGVALFQLNVFYNVMGAELRRRRRDAGGREAFHLQVELFDTELNQANLLVCSRLNGDLGLNATGMAIMEVGLLSGFSLRPGGVQPGQVIKKVETAPGKVVLYLDSVTTEEMCVSLPLLAEFKVAKVQEASVVVYDYYEPRRRTTRMYNSEWRSHMSSSSFCGEDHGECTGTIYDSNAAAPCGLSALLASLAPALLLFLAV